ncbi:MAG TPA: hypothetical protein VHU87_05970 [Rhizomicrobium sp.]|jgi:DNA topoisomerase-1|nr:hypothetical protein [Rhizomicrobium sp.]
MSLAEDAFNDPKIAAHGAGLRYCSDDGPGISRRRAGKGFAYFHPDGKKLRGKADLARIAHLAIPPAWEDVWISPHADCHLAATGRDVKGRKQYRYNEEFIRVRDAAKYDHVVRFAAHLPRLRRQVYRDMALPGLTRERVLATVVHLLETTMSRIGNESYARDNRSYGLTTLHNRHVAVRGDALKFQFLGKSGKTWRFHVESRRVAKVIRACQDLPGQHLFEYRDGEGTVHKIGSTDVNAYLQATIGEDFTAKDFRTWQGTMEAALALQEFASAKKQPTKADVKAALARAADSLGNTVAICRKCYVHPDVIARYEAGQFALDLPSHPRKSRSRFALRPEEKAVLKFLRGRKRRAA